MNADYLALLQRRLASTAVGPSTARGMGPKGTIQKARDFLAEVELQEFEVTTESDFIAALDNTTDALRDAMPTGARYWGSARKFLNIFLRSCTYNRHICSQYRLAPMEKWLEIPLDSHVAKGLRVRDGRTELPRWKTVVGLTRDVSNAYQHAAADVARTYGVHRIHLDLRYWRARDA